MPAINGNQKSRNIEGKFFVTCKENETHVSQQSSKWVNRSQASENTTKIITSKKVKSPKRERIQSILKQPVISKKGYEAELPMSTAEVQDNFVDEEKLHLSIDFIVDF